MNDGQRKYYEENLECDFSFEIPNLARFRVNAFVQNRGAGAVFRTIPSKVLTLEELNAKPLNVRLYDPSGLGAATHGAFVTALARTVGHFRGEGECTVRDLGEGG